MGFRSLFLIDKRTPAEKGAAVAAGAAGGSEGAFLSTKTILSFPVASAAVATLWKLMQHWGVTNDLCVLIPSALVGLAIFLIVISKPDGRPQGAGWVASIIIALVNTLLLAASALGIDKALGPR